ncbi:3-methyl-adenine DNA glycosylase I [Tritonibacter multivorans]|uniref:3-methyl-adenine DNA glycosylase I n=1 Tax=Tritonibacter multivorans TaxID=928856 RepID=A0A0N7M0Q5_9RHOB|nr:DNA-3-methyladenine glycosylase I [Tritonibacter multivorans]MDA7420690.1 DNA-3-methyladenine glycosylase I [Tritonibacter multivorans]CUH81121.1 3-methyl-adenine DNA glycosylase I [Tritonibacter multivorans]SFC28739.1 DNA-3-methyladenine glycosylase I [Tritonibacter multivorans]
MRSFDEIYDIAAARKGGSEALEAQLSRPDPTASPLPEDRWLSILSKGVFQAGFNWKVIETKWDGFEAAFHGFDVGRNAFMNDDDFDAHMRNTDIVRNATKIRSIRDNAVFLMELREEGGADKVLGGWPSEDFIGLLEMIKKRGSRLGGMTAQYSLRAAGCDAFILSQDVTARLIAEGVIDKPATSKTAMTAVQAAFNTWADQSGRSLTEISQVLARSV